MSGSGYVDSAVQQRIVGAIADDLVATAAKSQEEAVRLAQQVTNVKSKVEWWVGRGEDEFAMFVADEVQQQLHDGFEDTTWPACPEHHNHPLWLERDNDAGPPIWVCKTSRRSYGRLGELKLG